MRNDNDLLFLIAAYKHFLAHPGQTHYSDFEDNSCKRIKYLALYNHWYYGSGNIVFFDAGIHVGTWNTDVIKNIIDGKFTEEKNGRHEHGRSLGEAGKNKDGSLSAGYASTNNSQ